LTILREQEAICRFHGDACSYFPSLLESWRRHKLALLLVVEDGYDLSGGAAARFPLDPPLS